MYSIFKKNSLQPRKFNYVPWFYNPEKEEFENRIREAEEFYHGQNEDDKEKVKFKPKANFNFNEQRETGQYRNRESRFDTNYGKVNPFRMFTLIAILSSLVYFILFWN